MKDLMIKIREKTSQDVALKILCDMGLMLIALVVLLAGLDNVGELAQNWVLPLGFAGAAMLMVVMWRHLWGFNSVGLRVCMVLVMMALAMQLQWQPEELTASLVPLSMRVLTSVAGGLLLGTGILMVLRRLPEKRWITMIGAMAVLMVMFFLNFMNIYPFGYRTAMSLPIVLIGVIIQGLIYGSDCSDRIRVRESLLALGAVAVWLVMNDDMALVGMLAMVMLVMAAIYLDDRRWLVCLVAVLAAVAFTLLLMIGIGWDLYLQLGDEAPLFAKICAKIMRRIQRVTELYMNPAGADIYGAGFQLHRIREALNHAQLFGSSWFFSIVPQGFSICAFTTFVTTFGVIPAGLVLVFLLGIFRRSATIAVAAVDRREGAVGLAFGSYLMISGLLNAAGNVGLMPLMCCNFPLLADSGMELLLALTMLSYLACIPVKQEAACRTAMERSTALVWAVSGVAVMLILLQLLMISL